MDLGLENIQIIKSEQEFDYDKFFNGLIELNSIETEIQNDLKLIDTLDSITSCIKKYGVTESINFMFGENFSNVASMEAEAEQAKQNVIVRVFKAIMNFIRKTIDWIKDTFTGRKKLIEKLKEVKAHANEYEVPIQTIAARVNSVVTAKMTDWDKIAESVMRKEQAMLGGNIFSKPAEIADFSKYATLVHDHISSMMKGEGLTLSDAKDIEECCDGMISWLDKLNKINSISVDDLSRSYDKANDNNTTNGNKFGGGLDDAALLKARARLIQLYAGKLGIQESFKCVRDFLSKLKKKSDTNSK